MWVSTSVRCGKVPVLNVLAAETPYESIMGMKINTCTCIENFSRQVAPEVNDMCCCDQEGGSPCGNGRQLHLLSCSSRYLISFVGHVQQMGDAVTEGLLDIRLAVANRWLNATSTGSAAHVVQQPLIKHLRKL